MGTRFSSEKLIGQVLCGVSGRLDLLIKDARSFEHKIHKSVYRWVSVKIRPKKTIIMPYNCRRSNFSPLL